LAQTTTKHNVYGPTFKDKKA